MLDTAFEALKKFDWGSDLGALAPIEDAVTAAHGKPEARHEVETRLVTALQGELSRDAREYVCRKLAIVGTAACVPGLAPLLVNPESSHMSRFALEQIPAPEAAQALRDALSRASGTVKIGIISSLGARRDAASVPPLGELLQDGDAAIARAAALALGAIGSADSAAVLQRSLQAAGGSPAPIVDALLHCAETLMAANKLTEATAIYQAFAQDNQPRLVRLAANRGLLACASKQA
ncbi:MAG: HEAT repeat domain-containing protein [Planctomycetes bacterium]|nr:HEAT repeat domain-containing protein [Planctomycetota bacterium]